MQASETDKLAEERISRFRKVIARDFQEIDMRKPLGTADEIGGGQVAAIELQLDELGIHHPGQVKRAILLAPGGAQLLGDVAAAGQVQADGVVQVFIGALGRVGPARQRDVHGLVLGAPPFDFNQRRRLAQVQPLDQLAGLIVAHARVQFLNIGDQVRWPTPAERPEPAPHRVHQVGAFGTHRRQHPRLHVLEVQQALDLHPLVESQGEQLLAQP